MTARGIGVWSAGGAVKGEIGRYGNDMFCFWAMDGRALFDWF